MPNRRLSAVEKRATADAFGARVRPTLIEMQARGLSLNAMVIELRSKGVRAPRDGGWTPTAVRQVLRRIMIV